MTKIKNVKTFAGFTTKEELPIYLQAIRGSCQASKELYSLDEFIANCTERRDFHYSRANLKLDTWDFCSTKYNDVFKSKVILVKLDNAAFRAWVKEQPDGEQMLSYFGANDPKMNAKADELLNTIKRNLGIPESAKLYTCVKNKFNPKRNLWGIKELATDRDCRKLGFIIDDFKFIPTDSEYAEKHPEDVVNKPVLESLGLLHAFDKMAFNNIRVSLAELFKCDKLEDIKKPELTKNGTEANIRIYDYHFLDELKKEAKDCVREMVRQYDNGKLIATLQELNIDVEDFLSKAVSDIVNTKTTFSFDLNIKMN